MGKVVRRQDILKRDTLEFTEQGFLKVPIIAARTGIQIYIDENGNEIREYRPAEEVFRQETMDSLMMIPITNNHPREAVDSGNARLYTVGSTGETVEIVDNKFLGTNGVIFDQATIEDVRKGKVEVSLGYEVELDLTPGEFEGEKYDVIQRNIVHNHLAIVDKGRAGDEVRLRLDSGEAVLKDKNVIVISKGDSKMAKKIKIDGKEYEVDNKVAAHFIKIKKDQEEAEEKLKDQEEEEEEQKKKDEEEEEQKKKDQEEEEEKKKKEEDGGHETEKEKMDKLQAKNDALESDNKKLKEGHMDSTKVDSIVRDRTSAMKIGEKVLDTETKAKMDSMDTIDIKKAVITAESGDSMKGKSAVYVDARFDHIAATVSKSDKANDDASKKITLVLDEKGEKFDAAQKRKDSMKKDTDRWMEPVGRSKQEFAS